MVFCLFERLQPLNRNQICAGQPIISTWAGHFWVFLGMAERQELDDVQLSVPVDVGGVEQDLVFLHHVQLLKISIE